MIFEQYRIRIQHRSHERQILNAFLALATGVLSLIYPNFLYLIAGGYLLALGLVFILFSIPSTLAAVPIVAGLLIVIFPELIPVTFAIFLGLFGLMFLFAFQFAFLGVISLILAALIIINPGSIAYFVATFLLIYGVANLIRWYRGKWTG